MTAATAERNTAEREGSGFVYPVAAGAVGFAGTLAVLDAAGNCKPAVSATELLPVGRFEASFDNTGGAAGAIHATVKRGTFRWANSAAADAIAKDSIGDLAYLVDDQTVAKTSGTSTRSPAGIIVDVDTGGVWVYSGFDILVSPAGALLAASNLSDLANAATARTALGGGANKIVVALGAISTKGTDAAVVRFVSPVAGTLDGIKSVLNGALATGDGTLTAAINGVAVTTGVLTLTQAGSAAGDVDTCSPTAAKTVAVGDVITITGGGSSTATATASTTLLITPSA